MIAKPAAAAAAGPRRGLRLLRLTALLVLAAVLARSFVFAPFTIPSDSMLPTLARGDYLIASKWPYGWSRWSLPFDLPLWDGVIAAHLPQRGDIAVFRHPVTHVDYVKRVIGLPGDRVRLRGGSVELNGRPAAQAPAAPFVTRRDARGRCHPLAVPVTTHGGPECAYRALTETLPGGITHAVIDFGRSVQDDYGPVTVPAGHVFVLGDNRDNSLDSRFPARAGGGVGMVPEDLLIARVETVLFSTAAWPEWLTGLPQ